MTSFSNSFPADANRRAVRIAATSAGQKPPTTKIVFLSITSKFLPYPGPWMS
jgi:hypothetical protein